MTGKCYYLTTLGAWQRHAARFANSHWLALDAPPLRESISIGADCERAAGSAPTTEGPRVVAPGFSPASLHEIAGSRGRTAVTDVARAVEDAALKGGATNATLDDSTLLRNATTYRVALADATPIIVLVEADEGAHLALEDDAAFEALPHPLAQKPISDTAQSALAAHGVTPGASTFEVAEAVARAHPLLRHRVF
ncbi:MAG: hypothetical protein ACRD4S_00950 [Candidatus Acidiferrales bacterium]